jgi:hypothetical protein
MSAMKRARRRRFPVEPVRFDGEAQPPCEGREADDVGEGAGRQALVHVPPDLRRRDDHHSPEESDENARDDLALPQAAHYFLSPFARSV